MLGLVIAVVAEILLFSLIAPNFATVGNAFEVTRLSVELGLLAIALTPVLITGGIDLSVGSMMGLAAVLFGAAHRDWGLSLPGAVATSLLAGAAGGALNALLVARLGIPPLIVTLGTLSLFRGVAEGITLGAVNYTGFPPSLLVLGQGYIGGVIPAQLPILAVVLIAYGILLHRSAIGRGPGGSAPLQARASPGKTVSGREVTSVTTVVPKRRLGCEAGWCRMRVHTARVQHAMDYVGLRPCGCCRLDDRLRRRQARERCRHSRSRN